MSWGGGGVFLFTGSSSGSCHGGTSSVGGSMEYSTRSVSDARPSSLVRLTMVWYGIEGYGNTIQWYGVVRYGKVLHSNPVSC